MHSHMNVKKVPRGRKEYLGARFMEQFTVLESCIPFLFPMGRFVTDDLPFGSLTVHCIC